MEESLIARTTHLRAFTVLVAMAVAVLAAGLLVLGKPAEAAFPGTNGKIAFVSNRTAG